MVPPKRGSDGSYSSYSSAGSSSSGSRNYVDPWDVENALYVRGKRISFASDPSTFSAASAAVDPEPAAAICGCEPVYNGSSVLIPEPLSSVRYLTYCPFCDAEEHKKKQKKKGKGSLVSKISPPASITYKVPTAVDMDSSCEECCSAASCSSVVPPPPLMLFSNGRTLSAAGLRLASSSECHDCEDKLVSFNPTPRRFSVPTQPKLAYVYEAPRARAKTSLPSWSSARERSRDIPLASTIYQASSTTDVNNNRWERSRRLSLALPSAGLAPTPLEEQCDCPDHLPAGPHATLLAPPRHPCRWGMARSGHVAIDYTNAWMSLARRIKPSRA